MAHAHGCIWIDHREARIFGFSRDQSDDVRALHDPQAPHHLHRKADHVHLGKAGPDTAFLDEVASALGEFRTIMIFGPGTARTELAGHLAAHHPDLAKRITAIEPMDHPTEGQVLAQARKLARAADRMGNPSVMI